MVKRDLRQLADTPFDLLVIGGGIYGAAAAWDATQRGLSVAVIDKGDFGGGTSFNSAKTVHGGVRALQSGNLAEPRQFVRERRALSTIVPHLVQPLPFVIPTYAGLPRNRWLMRLYFALNDLLARDRNDVRDPAQRLPASRLLSRDECLTLSPTIDPTGVTGGIEWHDSQMYNSDRVTLSFLLSATQAGAVAANYVQATGLLWDHGRVTGAHVVVGPDDRDTPSDVTLDVRACVGGLELRGSLGAAVAGHARTTSGRKPVDTTVKSHEPGDKAATRANARGRRTGGWPSALYRALAGSRHCRHKPRPVRGSRK